MKKFSQIGIAVLCYGLSYGASAQLNCDLSVNSKKGECAVEDVHNTYKYLKNGGKCVAERAKNLPTSPCTDDVGSSVSQFSKAAGFSSSQYSQSEYSINHPFDDNPNPNGSYPSDGVDADNDGTKDKIAKYSSTWGFGSQKHAPVAIEREKEANSSDNYVYFVYTGPVTLDNGVSLATTVNGGNLSTGSAFHVTPNSTLSQDNKLNPARSAALGIYAAKYDPATKRVTKPTLIHAKWTDDFHDNAVINMDNAGHIYVLISGRNNNRHMILYRSDQPYSLDSFTDITPDVPSSNHRISYPKFFWMSAGYFRLIYNDYDSDGNRDVRSGKIVVNGSGKASFSNTTISTLNGYGHYVIGDAREGTNEIVIAFNEHSGGISERTNLYFMYSNDGGESWKDIDGNSVAIPLANTTALSNVAIREYNTPNQTRLIYMKDIAFDTTIETMVDGVEELTIHPEIVVLGITGPENDQFGNKIEYNQPSASGDRYLASWYRQNDNWVGKRFTNLVDHNYSTAALHQSGSSKIIYAQTPEGQENYLAGGSIAWGGLTQNLHTGGVLASSVTNTDFDSGSYCEFNNIRPIHTETVEGSADVWAVATGGNMQQYAPHNPIFIVLNGGEVRKLPSTSNTTSDWLNTTAVTSCTY